MITGYDAHGNFLRPQQLVDEIERLHGLIDQSWSRISIDRNAVIEECARVVEEMGGKFLDEEIAAAIRALKDK